MLYQNLTGTYRVTGVLDTCSKNVHTCAHMQRCTNIGRYLHVSSSTKHMYTHGLQDQNICSKKAWNKTLTVLGFCTAEWIPAAFLIHKEPFLCLPPSTPFVFLHWGLLTSLKSLALMVIVCHSHLRTYLDLDWGWLPSVVSSGLQS